MTWNKILPAVVGLLMVASVSYGRPTDCPEQYFQAQAPDFINPKLGQRTQEVCYSGYGGMHSGVTRTPLYVSEKLTRARLLQGKGLKRENKFHSDEHLRASDRAELVNYARSGFDRGHMAPSGDMFDVQSQFESFSLANMIPQVPEINRGVWERIESAVRTLAKQRGELYVVTGPLFNGGKIDRIGGAVMVPTQMFKAIYDPARNEAGAYLVDNALGAQPQKLSLAELEKLAEMNIFPTLDKSTKNMLMRLPDPKSRNGKGGW